MVSDIQNTIINRFLCLRLESPSSSEYIQIKKRLENYFLLLGRDQNSELIDIQMIANVIFTLILVCSIIHLCLFLLTSEYFGPLLVSLITMSKNIYRWFIFIIIFVAAYQTSFLHLFSYYSADQPYGDIRNHGFNTTTTSVIGRAKISITFGDIRGVLINVFYSLLGIIKNELTQTYCNINLNETINSTHYYLLNTFTSTVGSLIYGSFAFIARIILITMIIAYIKRLYYLNKQQALNDWKFARAKFYMTFIDKDFHFLPIPFNLILTPRYLMEFFRKKSPIGKNLPRKNKFLRNLNYSLTENNIKKKATNDDIMGCIILRFLSKYHPLDIHSLKRIRQIQYKEELSEIRHYILDEIQSVQQANRTLKKHIATVFFDMEER
jgi:hypothetical protein